MLPEVGFSFFLFSLPDMEPPIFHTVLYFLTKGRSPQNMTSMDLIEHGSCGCPRSHISPISSPHLAFLTIRPWRETSCAGGESTRHRLSQRNLWTDNGKPDKVSASSTPSQTD